MILLKQNSSQRRTHFDRRSVQALIRLRKAPSYQESLREIKQLIHREAAPLDTSFDCTVEAF